MSFASRSLSALFPAIESQFRRDYRVLQVTNTSTFELSASTERLAKFMASLQSS